MWQTHNYEVGSSDKHVKAASLWHRPQDRLHEHSWRNNRKLYMTDGLIWGYKNDRPSLVGSCSDRLIWDQFCLLALDEHWRATFTLIVRKLCVCLNTQICVFVSECRLMGSRFRGHSPHRERWRRTCSQELPGRRQGRCKASCGQCSTRPGQEGAHAAAHPPGYSSAWGESYSFGY